MRNLMLMVGPPGCGKSSWANINKQDYNLICLDDIRLAMGAQYDHRHEPFVKAICSTMVRALMIRSRDIIVDATNVQQFIIEGYRKLCIEYDYKLTGVIFKANKTTCWNRRNACGFSEIAFDRIWDEYVNIYSEIMGHNLIFDNIILVEN